MPFTRRRESRIAAWAVTCALVLMACHRRTAGNATEEPAGSTASTPEPPPLDTNWQRNPGHALRVGDRAPDFEGIAHTGMRVRLSGFSGKPVVVYFASTDASPEGTAEARTYRDQWMRFNEKIGAVLGVTSDDRAVQYDFATGEKLPFLLVADEKGHIARAFGVASEQGRSENVTFVVGSDGKILRVFAEPTAEGHASAVIAAIEAM